MTEETTTVDPLERVAQAFAGLGDRIEASVTALGERLVAQLTPPAPVVLEPLVVRTAGMLPGETLIDPSDAMRDAYTADWWDDNLTELQNHRAIRANFEFAKIIQGGARLMEQPINLNFSEDFEAAWRANLFENKRFAAPRVLTGDPKLKKTRAMDTAETGYGLELVGVEYSSEMWRAARNLDTLVNDVRVVPMKSATMYVPIDGNVPEMLFVGENTSPTASPYTSSKTPSSRVLLSAKKFTIQQIWSRELEEDSVIAFVPFLREMLAMSAALHLGSAYYNGDDTNAGTGNINTDDADPTDTKHYLAFDGIRHYWLVDATGQGKDQAAALNLREINVARGKLNGGDDDVDNALTNINWGTNPRDLRLIMDWDTYMAMLDTDKVTTVDKYGPAATVLTGELGSYAGIPIISPPYASKTEADGKASTTEASNTKGQITVFNPRGFLGGDRRSVEVFMSRLQGRDQFLFELYTRRAFKRWGANVAAGIYDITL